MAFVYTHHKADTDEIFYVGIGAASDGKNLRAYDKHKRSKFWKSLVSRHGFYAVVVAENIKWEEAIAMEIELIAKYGRSNNGTGVLCNLTDGGEGCKGHVFTEEQRKKMSIAQKGKKGLFGSDNPFFGKTHTPEVRAKLSASLKASDKNKGVNNPNYGKPISEHQKQILRERRLGQKHPEEVKEKIRAWGKGRPKSEEWKAKLRGENNFWYGKGDLMRGENSPTAKKYVFIETGEIFKGLEEACKVKGLSYHTQRAYLHPNHVRHERRKFNYLIS